MLDPAELMRAAHLLATAGSPPSDGQLRRAISTAYYAVFHTLNRAGAERFMGADAAGRPGYSILYRGFGHGRMKAVCVAVDVPRLSPTLQRQLGRDTLHQALRDCASDFVALQGARHLADYDPNVLFSQSEALGLVAQAELAIASFDRAPEAERSDLLALMLAPSRD